MKLFALTAVFGVMLIVTMLHLTLATTHAEEINATSTLVSDQAFGTYKVHGRIVMNTPDCPVQDMPDSDCATQKDPEKFTIIARKFADDGIHKPFFEKRRSTEDGTYSIMLTPGMYTLQSLAYRHLERGRWGIESMPIMVVPSDTPINLDLFHYRSL